MAVSNPASFSSIKAEFGGSDNFSDYYRGGPYVPASSSATISTTAAGLAMSQFNGVSKPVSFSASATQSSVSGSRSTGGTCISGSVGVNTTGGTGTITYAWQYVSGDTNIVCSNSAASAVSFSGNVSALTTSRSAVWHCKVTNGDGTVAYTGNVSITLNYTGTA